MQLLSKRNSTMQLKAGSVNAHLIVNKKSWQPLLVFLFLPPLITWLMNRLNIIWQLLADKFMWKFWAAIFSGVGRTYRKALMSWRKKRFMFLFAFTMWENLSDKRERKTKHICFCFWIINFRTFSTLRHSFLILISKFRAS